MCLTSYPNTIWMHHHLSTDLNCYLYHISNSHLCVSISRLSYGSLMGLMMGQTQLFDFQTLRYTYEYRVSLISLTQKRKPHFTQYSQPGNPWHGLRPNHSRHRIGSWVGHEAWSICGWVLVLATNKVREQEHLFLPGSHSRIQTMDAQRSWVWLM